MTRPPSSPPCFLHEVDPAYQGYLDPEALLALLNELLEAERAGAKVLARMAAEAADAAQAAILSAVGRDEARFCALLRRHILALGGTPSRRTGAFREKVLALEGLGPRLELLNRGQGWVVRKLAEALPKLQDERLHRELREMLEVHEANIERASAL